MKDATRTGLCLLTAGLLLLTTLPPPVNADSVCAPTTSGVGSCTFVSGPAAPGTYVYDTIIVPGDVLVTVGSPVVLQARTLLLIDGQILGDSATLPGAPAPSIRLSSEGQMTVNGMVRMGDGADALGRDSHVSGATGDLGGSGGGIYVSVGLLGAFHLTGTLRSGNGGDGGYMRVFQEKPDPPTATIQSTGGAGGQAGAISIDAISALIQGKIVVGDGGAGGVGYALAYPGTLAASPGGLVSATGGPAGAAGVVNLPLGLTPMSLIELGLLEGGIGGAGGSAYAYSWAIPTTLYGAQGDSDWDTGADATCVPVNGATAGADGGQGCQGGSASARGETGGQGIMRGGEGGWAYAYGGKGSLGGNGAAGYTATCVFFGYYSSCGKHGGGHGGRGGTGGPANAQGGTGGEGIVEGGRGGTAYAWGGMAGNGGNGGKGGHGNVWNWNGELTWDTAQAIGCTTVFPNGVAAIVCAAIIPNGAHSVCAAGGHPGPPGQLVRGSATPGAGGMNALLVRGGAGGSNEYHGGNGQFGNPGASPYWPEFINQQLVDHCAGYY